MVGVWSKGIWSAFTVLTYQINWEDQSVPRNHHGNCWHRCLLILGVLKLKGLCNVCGWWMKGTFNDWHKDLMMKQLSGFYLSWTRAMNISCIDLISWPAYQRQILTPLQSPAATGPESGVLAPVLPLQDGQLHFSPGPFLPLMWCNSTPWTLSRHRSTCYSESSPRKSLF